MIETLLACRLAVPVMFLHMVFFRNSWYCNLAMPYMWLHDDCFPAQMGLFVSDDATCSLVSGNNTPTCSSSPATAGSPVSICQALGPWKKPSAYNLPQTSANCHDSDGHDKIPPSSAVGFRDQVWGWKGKPRSLTE